jgi:RsiW-degrading membrane proteinase PrsW (M82 family)
MTMARKIAQLTGDFLFGSFLIGFLPWVAFIVSLILDTLFSNPGSEMWLQNKNHILSIFSFITVLVAFGFAICYRLRHRLLPKWVIAGEILCGVIAAFFLIIFFALITP